jgi:cytochrome oxidase Cu insertion factor (SCO1/SenC/PrrC family)
MRPPLPLIAVLAVIVLVGVIAAGAWHVTIGIPGLPPLKALDGPEIPLAQPPVVGGSFTLVDHSGKTVTDADYRGRHLLIYFGYTFCPDMCPTALTTIGEALRILGKAGDKVTPALISIDPERDTPEQLKMYVSYFHPRQIALTGSAAQVAAVAEAYQVFYAKAKREGDDPDDYLMDHTSATFLVGPDGKVMHRFGHATDPEAMAARLKELL